MNSKHEAAVYILSNKTNTALYTGVTHNLIRRTFQHKEKLTPGFTRRYNIEKLVYYEFFADIRDAIAREKQIKAGSRKKKIALVESMNPEWKDMFDDIVE